MILEDYFHIKGPGKMLKIFSYFFLLFSVSFFPQSMKSVNLEVLPLYKEKPVTISEDKPFVADEQQGLEISKLKFYLSHFEFYRDDKLVFSEENSYHLIDASDERSMKIMFSIPENLKFNHIKFYLGIDRKTNNEGIHGGDLDPTKGMYWAWQTGYINFKLEGKSSLSPDRNHEFRFHLGGYSDPFYAIQEISLPVSSDNILLNMDLDQFILKANLAERNSIMIPGKEAVALSGILSTIFRTER